MLASASVFLYTIRLSILQVGWENYYGYDDIESLREKKIHIHKHEDGGIHTIKQLAVCNII